MSTAATIQNREAIIEMAASGAKLSEIAERFDTRPCTISQQLAKDPEYIAARETAAEIRLDDRESDLETAPPLMAEISRASQLLSHQRWRCEREFPQKWGAKPQDGPTGITIVIADGLAKTVAVAQQTHGNATDLDSVQQQKCLIAAKDTQRID